jgi:hypothetical protein
MDMDFSAFEYVSWQMGAATHPLASQVMRLPLHPQGAGRIRKAAHAAMTPLSLVVAGIGLLPTRKGQAVVVKPLKWQQRRSPRFVASARPDAPSGASNCGF